MQATIELGLEVRFAASCASCWPAPAWDESLTTILLRLAGPAGARFECLACDVVGKPLRWGPLAEGRWSAEAVLVDVAGNIRAVAPLVRFRAVPSQESKIDLRFQLASQRS
jgi:hypothetical protein